MTFFTLLVVLTQTVSVGVVDKSRVLANGTRLMPGDRVLAIHDTAHPWLALVPPGGFLPRNSSRIMSSDGPSTDSSRARVQFDSAEALRLQRTPGLPYPPEIPWRHGRLPGFPNPRDSARQQVAARLYKLSLEISRRLGNREMAANALLRLATLDVERGADTAALAGCRNAATWFVGVKSMFGRTDAYATWQMMELAWGHKQTAPTCSLARKIILDYPTEVGQERVITEVGEGGTPAYGSRSIWFDVQAAERLLDAVAGDESQVAAAAEFLLKSKSVAVKFRAYEKLIALSEKHSDTAAARSYARAALALPHYWQWEVWPPSGCTNQGGRNKHDFKDEFIDSLDVLLPFSDLLQLYDSTYDLKDTMMSRDAANWFMRQIERGRTPPRAGILDRIDAPKNSAELKRALLVSMTGAPQFRTAVECTLFTHRPDDYPRYLFSQTLPRGSLVQPYGMREGWVRVATPDGFSGWTNARSLRGTVSLWDIPAVEMVEPVATTDFNDDAVRDLRLSTTDIFDGKDLMTVRPPDRKNSWGRQIGVYRKQWVESRGDTLWLYGVGADTIATGVPESRKTKKGVCKPGACFYFVATPNPNESFAWVSAVRELGTVWTTPISVRMGWGDAVYQVDSTLIITGGDSAWLLSAVNGAQRGRIATSRSWKSWRGVFFNRSGYAVAKGDSVIYRDYSGSREFGVAIGKSNAQLFPPFAVSFESDIWGVRRFGQVLCPITAEAIPFVSLVHRYDGENWRYDIALHLISLKDGRELAKVAMSENYYDCHYDEHGVYVSDDTSFRAITWEGKPLTVADLPLLSYPIWDGDRIVSYYSRPMGTMFEAGAASRLADAVRPLRSRWSPMDNRRESGE